ncbi:MAG: hypothetical protein JST53_11005 [Actinobacteria bacterium]|nr:hypothetical protein [Actinomycetota bacterium]
MQVVVGPFTRQGIEERLGPDLPAGVEIALLYYVGKLRSGRGAPEFPSFLQNASFEGPVSEIELNVGPEVESVLSAEAERRHTTVDRLAAHSVFLYLAELDRLEEEGAAATS